MTKVTLPAQATPHLRSAVAAMVSTAMRVERGPAPVPALADVPNPTHSPTHEGHAGQRSRQRLADLLATKKSIRKLRCWRQRLRHKAMALSVGVATSVGSCQWRIQEHVKSSKRTHTSLLLAGANSSMPPSSNCHRIQFSPQCRRSEAGGVWGVQVREKGKGALPRTALTGSD
jgi:hypothetical protein